MNGAGLGVTVKVEQGGHFAERFRTELLLLSRVCCKHPGVKNVINELILA